MRTEYKVIAGSICLGVLFWILSAFTDWLLYYDGTFWQLLITGVPSHELFMRLVVFGILLSFGAIIARMISKRKQAETRSKHSQEYFRALTEEAQDGIIVIDSNTTTRYISPSFERMIGYNPEELYGKDIFELVHEDDIPLVADTFSSLVNNQVSKVQTEVRVRHKDGSFRVLEATGTNLQDNKAVSGIVGNFRDITERKYAEESLRLKENALENSLNAIAMTDMEGNLTYVNQAYLRLLGNNRKEDILGKPYGLLLESGENSAVREVIRSMLENQCWEGELVARGKHVHVFSSLLKDDDGNPVQTVSFIIDITERKKAEAALRESEEQYSALVASLADAVLRFRNDTVIWCNDRVKDIYGYEREELVGKNMTFFLPDEPDPQEFLKSAYKDLLENKYIHYTATAVRKSGSRVNIDYSVSMIPGKDPTELVVVARNITDRANMEAELRKSEERLKRYLDNSPDVIVVVDTGGTIHYANTTARRIIGYTSEELIGKNFFDLGLLAPSNTSKPQQWLEDGGAVKPTKRNEYEIVRKDGSMIVAEVSTIPLGPVPGTTRTEIVAIARDVTERKIMEQQLQLSGRLASVGQLSAGVAHELNNPLAAIQAFAQFLASRKDMDETIKSDIETIFKEAQRASRITANLLSFARKHNPERSLISINEVIEKSLELHAYRMKVNNIEVEMKLDPDLPTIMADFHQIQQVFVNLITNAEHAMTEANGKGKLSIETKAIGKTICITFSDDGPGIPKENLDKLFDPFFTTKEVGKGTGLGLSICYGIVEEHGGRIHARSKPGKGATFIMEIPVVSENQINVTSNDSKHISKTAAKE